VVKTRVFALARWRNAHDPYGTGANPIPERIITRPPSAELREDQTEDSLPPYEVLDAIIARYMEHDAPSPSCWPRASPRRRRARHAPDQGQRIQAPQAPVGTRVTPRGFGKDWRYPMTNRFRA
jgi:NAD+ synthase (glutamine-hydrolysing)